MPLQTAQPSNLGVELLWLWILLALMFCCCCGAGALFIKRRRDEEKEQRPASDEDRRDSWKSPVEANKDMFNAHQKRKSLNASEIADSLADIPEFRKPIPIPVIKRNQNSSRFYSFDEDTESKTSEGPSK